MHLHRTDRRLKTGLKTFSGYAARETHGMGSDSSEEYLLFEWLAGLNRIL